MRFCSFDREKNKTKFLDWMCDMGHYFDGISNLTYTKECTCRGADWTDDDDVMSVYSLRQVFSFLLTLMFCATFKIFRGGQKRRGRRWSEQNILTGVVKNLGDVLTPSVPSQIDSCQNCVYF